MQVLVELIIHYANYLEPMNFSEIATQETGYIDVSLREWESYQTKQYGTGLIMTQYFPLVNQN